jgi:hypothetical protein
MKISSPIPRAHQEVPSLYLTFCHAWSMYAHLLTVMVSIGLYTSMKNHVGGKEGMYLNSGEFTYVE